MYGKGKKAVDGPSINLYPFPLTIKIIHANSSKLIGGVASLKFGCLIGVGRFLWDISGSENRKKFLKWLLNGIFLPRLF